MRNLFLVTFAVMALGLSSCASFHGTGAVVADAPGITLAPQDAAPGGAPPDGAVAEAATEKPAPEAVAEDESRGFLTHVLLYLPNRVMDLFDVGKAGVDVGLGLGIELKATEYVQAMALTTVAIGVGFQGLRHVPFRVGPEAAFGVGPLGGAAEVGGWYRSPSEFRVGGHLFLVGAHASVDPLEILDFALGFLLIDIQDDDF